ncbi:MAG TPA: tetratricopeptide repeat protein, partial [Sphingomonas sp.]
MDGWKAIGAHFGRDRTTAIRWARDRGLPIRSLPGGKTRTVYALRSELDAWARLHDTAPAQGPPVPPAAAQPVPPRAKRSPRGWWGAAALGLAGAAAIGLLIQPSDAPAKHDLAVPADPASAALYVQGRDEAHRRDADSMTAAVAHLR